jgi:hypothetical protein
VRVVSGTEFGCRLMFLAVMPSLSKRLLTVVNGVESKAHFELGRTTGELVSRAAAGTAISSPLSKAVYIR